MSRRDLDAADLPRPTEKLRRVDQVMEVVGIVLIPLGLTALLMGWIGVASNGHVFLQLPYVVSGGLLGVGLLFAAGTIYLASWISRTSAVQRRQNEELLSSLRQLQATLGALPLAGAADAAGAVNGSSGGHFLATPSGTMFHRPDCAIVTARDDTHEVDPHDGGMQPCGMCDPLGADDGVDPDVTTVIDVPSTN